MKSKYLLSLLITIILFSCKQQVITVDRNTVIPLEIKNTLKDSVLKYNQTTILYNNYLYVIENKFCIKKISLSDDFVFGLAVGIILELIIIGCIALYTKKEL